MKYVTRSENVKPIYDKAASATERKKNRPAPISMRFNEAQLAKLKPHAGNHSLGIYCRDYILKGHNLGAGGAKPGLFQDQVTVAQILREIGLSGISENLRTIKLELQSKGVGQFESLDRDITGACADIALMRSELLKSLNVHDRRNK
jgi:hypothetical protein